MTTWRLSFAFTTGGTWQYLWRDGVFLPVQEIKAHASAIRAAEGLVAMNIFLAAIMDKIEAAKRGELEPPDDVKTDMARASGVHELRWRLDNDHWRLYYCEPLRLTPKKIMLALRFNEKTSKEQQNDDLDEAAVRYIWWQSTQTS